MADITIEPRQATGPSFFLSLVTGRLKPGKLWLDPEYRVKYLFRSMAYPVTTWKMVNALATEPVLREILPIQHSLPSKIHRPYLYGGMPVSARAQAILDHYAFAKNLPAAGLRRAMLTQQGATLVEFKGKNEEAFSITLACSGRCEREGEVNLAVSCNDVQLATLTFAVMRDKGEKVVMIGGIQGAHRDTPHETIRDATKACYGLFPKRLLMETLSLFCQATGVAQIRAVSDSGHIFRSLRYRLKKKSLFHASYNEFWETLNARPLSPKLYALPVAFPRKPLEDIASKKRSEARRRYELLDNMAAYFAQHYAG
ncbi:VirK/YbjX family protein [Pantoea sp. FN060301]|uniref:VirK/YbjX family protein n=1 Tax=Pantoea sp. FN060301 TaxID=3420380 RepID=UPI003D179DCD